MTKILICFFLVALSSCLGDKRSPSSAESSIEVNGADAFLASFDEVLFARYGQGDVSKLTSRFCEEVLDIPSSSAAEEYFSDFGVSLEEPRREFHTKSSALIWSVDSVSLDDGSGYLEFRLTKDSGLLDLLTDLYQTSDSTCIDYYAYLLASDYGINVSNQIGIYACAAEVEEIDRNLRLVIAINTATMNSYSAYQN